MEENNYNLDVIVNLSAPDRGRRNIGLNWLITIPARQKTFMQKLFKTGKDIIEKSVSLLIDDLMVPDNLVTSGPLFTLVRGEMEFTEDDMPYNMVLDSLTTTFQVYLNEQNIIDYKEAHDKSATKAPISFCMKVTDDREEVIARTQVNITLELTRIEDEPEAELECHDEIQYSSDPDDRKKFLGTLSVRSTGSLKYAAPVSVRGMIDAIYENKPANALLRIEDADGNEVTSISTHPLSEGAETNYSLFLLMEQLTNPVTDRAHLKLIFKGTYRIGTSIDNRNLTDLVSDIDIIQDPQGSELIVTHDGQRIFDKQEVVLPEYEFFAQNNLNQEIYFKLGNIAKDTSRRRAGLKIFNLGINTIVDNNVRLIGPDGKAMTTEGSGIFSVQCSNPDIKNAEGVFIPNGTNAEGENHNIEIMLLFSAKNIANVKGASDFHFTAEVNVTFEYYENSNGIADVSKLERKTFTMTVVQPLYLRPNAQWLCVDYGTSAIVCLYDNEIIDLKKRKDAIIKKSVSEPKLQADDFEKKSQFLSSDIVFHNIDSDSKVSSLATEQPSSNDENYGNLSVFLSPTSSMYVYENLRLLPCLKLLVGNYWLPKNKYIAPYEYNRNDEDGKVIRVTADKDRDHESSLMKVDQVFRQSYEALFRYYISTEVPDRNRINRLVLTYPNTYTPRHIATLREVVNGAFPSLRVLEFVSESDAVAAYYLKHWYDYAVKNAEITDDENILVFDMGAGTLDISFIEKIGSANGDITMDILGKLGTSKAGNYLDFVLAQIVAELTDLTSNTATTKAAYDENESKARTELKLFVKTKLKPILNESKRGKTLKYNKVDITIGDVLDHNLFQEFLSACTDNILTQLVQYLDANNGKVRIDTVLMSGRSCLLKPLQTKLKEAISKITDSTPNFVVLDKPNRNADGNTERQKTAVAEGAMEIADNYRRPGSTIHVKSRRHYASFGIAYSVTGGKKVYHEILSHYDIPAGGKLNRYMSKEITLNHLNNVTQLQLIQSYLSAQETELALNNNDYEFVTEMEEIDTQALGCPKSLNAKLCIDSNNDIIVYFGTQRTLGQQPRGEDLQSEDTKRSIWPVTI